MNTSSSKGMNKILNLIRFNCNFSKYCDVELLDQDPSYIIEKYSHWIGFDPITRFPIYTPDSCEQFISKYYKRWGAENSELVRRELLYLNQTKSIKLSKMIRYFETYFGPIDMISSESKSGLHSLVEKQFIPLVIEKNREDITIAMRELKVIQIVNEI